MFKHKTMQKLLGAILLSGTLISLAIVTIGGVLYLMQNGTDLMSFSELRIPPNQAMTTQQIWTLAFSFSPLGIVALGLLLLVTTQLLRVGLLLIYYTAIRDYWFILISGFILAVLAYSFIWRE